MPYVSFQQVLTEIRRIRALPNQQAVVDFSTGYPKRHQSEKAFGRLIFFALLGLPKDLNTLVQAPIVLLCLAVQPFDLVAGLPSFAK